LPPQTPCSTSSGIPPPSTDNLNGCCKRRCTFELGINPASDALLRSCPPRKSNRESCQLEVGDLDVVCGVVNGTFACMASKSSWREPAIDSIDQPHPPPGGLSAAQKRLSSAMRQHYVFTSQSPKSNRGGIQGRVAGRRLPDRKSPSTDCCRSEVSSLAWRAW
jgi:hypothetical protein